MLKRMHDWLLLLLTVPLVFETGCRSPRKGLRVGADAAELKVTMEGLAPEETGKSAWIYEISGCLPTLNGTLSESNPQVVIFKAPGIKRELKGCQFRVKVAELPPDVRPVSGAEPGVLFWASDLIIRNDISGALVANAALQKMFDRVKTDAQGIFTLKIKVAFPSGNIASSITGALQCDPSVVSVGSYAGDSQRGELEFLISTDTEKTFSCSNLYINADGKLQVYTANLSADGQFTVTPGGKGVVGPITLIKQESEAVSPTPPPSTPVTPPGTDPATSAAAPDGIQVKTLGTETCRDNEVFDIEKFQCQAR